MYNLDLMAKASKIKLVAFDVDGVMTDGGMIYDQNGIQYKIFNAKDGQGIAMLSNAGLKTAIITAKESGAVLNRFKDLGMTKLYQGQKKKIEALQEMIIEFNIDASEVAYMGDDLPDIPVLQEVGLACCPNDAVNQVKEICHLVSSKCGGRGAVRELADLILRAQKLSV
ncbi:HAD-IIIA family hydrolase [bacterium]|nr:HAD-IIIA family hydrolase [bacterium]